MGMTIDECERQGYAYVPDEDNKVRVRVPVHAVHWIAGPAQPDSLLTYWFGTGHEDYCFAAGETPEDAIENIKMRLYPCAKPGTDGEFQTNDEYGVFSVDPFWTLPGGPDALERQIYIARDDETPMQVRGLLLLPSAAAAIP